MSKVSLVHVLAREEHGHVFTYPPTCLCCPLVVEEKANDVKSSPIVVGLMIYHPPLAGESGVGVDPVMH